MILVLTGTNDFARSAELKKLMSAFLHEHGDFALEKVEAGEVEYARLVEIVSSLPFLASKRTVIIHDPSSNKTLNENIEKFIAAIDSATDVILVERKFDKRLSLYKTLKKKATVKEFTELDERGLVQWAVNEVKSKGGGLQPAEAAYLVQRVGLSQQSLYNELEKLLTYQPVINRTTIDLLTEQMPQGSVFDLLDAAFSGNTKNALKLYKELRTQHIEPQAIMGMIAWQVHIIAVVKSAQKLSASEIASRYKISPFVVNKTLNSIHKMTSDEMKKLVARTLALDTRIKSESVDVDDAIQHYLLTL